MAVDELQKVFKTLTDPTRIRVLALLAKEELAVQDLVKVLGMPQSTVSRHLAILREAGLLRDRREGTFAYYRFIPPMEPVWRDGWKLAARALAEDSVCERDREALESLLTERSHRNQVWFDSLGPEWDNLRSVFQDDVQRARAIAKLVPRELRVADIGTGTGILARELAATGVSVVAIDHSRRMLTAASQKLIGDMADHVEFRHGDAASLPLADGEVDAALAHMVLHYVASPGEAIREMARVVRPGGRVVVVDFVDSDAEWLKADLEMLWQGFPLESIRSWLDEAGLEDIDLEQQECAAKGRALPATFIASARRPIAAASAP